MLLSELIKTLENGLEKFGDVEVFGTLFDIDDGEPILEILQDDWDTSYDEHFVEPASLGVNHPAYGNAMRRVLVARTYMDWVF